MTDLTVLQPFIRANSWLEEYPTFKNIVESCTEAQGDLFQDVNDLILSLNLKDFEDPTKGQGPIDPQVQKGNAENSDIPDPSKRPNSQFTNLGNSQLNNQLAGNSLNSQLGHVETGKLNKLTHLEPLSRPPQTSISDVSIVTKVTNMDGNYQPIRTQKSRRRFSFKSLSARARNSSKTESPLPHAISAPLENETRMLRQKRSSLVGQTLPSYIQDQLDKGPTRENLSQKGVDGDQRVDFKGFEGPEEFRKGYGAREARVSMARDSSAYQKGKKDRREELNTEKKDNNLADERTDERPSPLDSRIHNLLSNSTSFHLHSGTGSGHVPPKEAGSPILETELEYISPNSFTKSIEYLEPSYLNSADLSADENDYENGEGSSSIHDDELFFPKISDS